MDDLTFSAQARRSARSARPAGTSELDARFRTLVQSPLRAGILRYLSARPDESFDVESADADVRTPPARRRELRPRARRLRRRRTDSRRSHRATWPSGRRRSPTCSTSSWRRARRRQQRRPVAVGAALPRDDRPRREDAGRLRVDPHGRQVGHLRARARADRIGQGTRRADDPRAVAPQRRQVPGGQLRGAARHAVRVGNLRLRKGRVHRRARSQARAASSWRTRARCSSTKSATCR